MRCNGIIAELPEGMNILKENHKEGEREFIIQISPEQSPNDLLRFLLPQVEIHHFEENIPSINDIFIQLVGESAN